MRRSNRRPRHISGAALLEVMVSVSIMAAAMVAAFASQTQSVSLCGEAGLRTTGALLAQQKAAELMAGGPEKLVPGQGDFGPDFPAYAWRLTVPDLAPSDLEGISGDLKRLDLTITREGSERFIYEVRLYRFLPGGR
jgi:hypothetical protein